MANMMQMMTKAQQFKKKMEELQQRMQQTEFDGTAGGVVACRLNGKFELKFLKIDPSAVDPADVETLEDLVAAAINDAHANATQRMAAESDQLLKDMGLPANLGLPF